MFTNSESPKQRNALLNMCHLRHPAKNVMACLQVLDRQCNAAKYAELLSLGYGRGQGADEGGPPGLSVQYNTLDCQVCQGCHHIIPKLVVMPALKGTVKACF